MLNKVGFEYLDKQGESVFETFLKHTDEKEKSSALLGKILKRLFIRDKMTFLDVGSGNGEYLRLSLNQILLPKGVKFTLLEPSGGLIKQLRLTVKSFPFGAKVEIIQSTWDNFTGGKQFDVILASHLPLVRKNLSLVFGKMLKLIKPNGSLIVVLRRKDDIHKFRTMFKSQLMGKDYQSLVIDDALKIFNKLAKVRPLKILTYSVDSELRLPAGNRRDIISIIEFFLNKKWGEFPVGIQETILKYINKRKGVFHQTDGFVLVKKI